MKKIKQFFMFLFIVILFFPSCKNPLEPDVSSSLDGRYGTLIINGDSARSVDVNSITRCLVWVSCDDFSDVVYTEAEVSGGVASGIILEKVPVGKNRIITVQAYNESTKLSGITMRAVADINTGNNSVTVNWDSNPKGNLFQALLSKGVEVSALDPAQVDSLVSAIPETDSYLVDVNSIAEDFSASGLKAPGSYKLDPGTFTANIKGFEESLTVEIGDPSSVPGAVSGESVSIENVAPGVWPVIVKDSTGKVVLETTVVIKSGEENSFGDLTNYKYRVYLSNCTWGTKKIYYYDDSGNENDEWELMPEMVTTGPVPYYDLNEDWVEPGKTMVIFFGGSGTNRYPADMKDGVVLPAGVKEATFNLNTKEWETSSSGGSGAVEVPEFSFSPSNDKLVEGRNITVTFNPGSLAESGNLAVSVAGITYTEADFNNGILTIPYDSLGLSVGDTVSLSATMTNSLYPLGESEFKTYTVSERPAVPDTFTWDNVLCYFVLTDRFYDGDPDNNNCYGRVNEGVPSVATFNGGDIKGLTEKLDYLQALGVNSIWITAPYEQMHGWTGGKNNQFPHYAFHGYYTQDWTFMDQNMGTIEEFRTFVNEAHSRGIRVVMDVVMNHTGYDNWQDMIDYNFGGFYDDHERYNHACFPTNGQYLKGDGSSWGTNWNIFENGWQNWWCSWVRAFGDKADWPTYENGGYGKPASNLDSDPIKGSLSGLPDVITEETNAVSIPVFLKTKWGRELNNTTETSYGNNTGYMYKDYQLPSVSNVDWNGKSGDWRTDNKGAPADYIIVWLSGWVREFGIDGFRCDTAKHVEKSRWGELKDACEAALKAWRNDSSKSDGGSGAKDWDESFWMTGEHFGWTPNMSDDYFVTGKFDSMINFRFNPSQWGGIGSSGTTPSTSDWASYASMFSTSTDGDNNGNRNNALSYISSHDTGLHRPGDQLKVGTMLCLLPGGVQIYYGDESSRPAVDSFGDTDMATRGLYNWGENTESVEHWGRVGTFRKFNPAVGAGSQVESGGTYLRSYTGSAGENEVAICISGSSASVGDLYGDGTTVYNWYDGSSAVVSGGSVSFGGSAGTSNPWLISDRNPADYGVVY